MARHVELKALPLQSTLLSTLEETICLQVGYTFLLCVGLCKPWRIYSGVIDLIQSLLVDAFLLWE